MISTVFQAKKISHQHIETVEDSLTAEFPFEISMNDVPFTVTMRTPGHDLALLTGLLFTENVIHQKIDTAIQFDYSETPHRANVTLPTSLLGDGLAVKRNQMSVSSCGICGKASFEEEKGNLTQAETTILSFETILQAFDTMNKQQIEFANTGGSHAAAAFDGSGKMLAVFEDIGRHNAVDKVIGGLLIANQLPQAKLLTVSGRISYEIITKAHKAQIPILAAVSAPSTYAVEKANELGITLLAFCRQNRVSCYSNPQRIREISPIKHASLPM